jgi:translation initiation factor 2A
MASSSGDTQVEVEAKSDPPCRVVVRSKTDVKVFVAPERSNDEVKQGGSTILQGSTSLQQLSPDGSAAYFLLADHGIVRCDLNDPKLQPVTNATSVFLENSKNIQMMDLSPSGAYILTWERWYEHSPNNLKVWEAASGKLLAGFPLKNLKRDAWPNLQWTHDEKFAFLLNNKQVHVYLAESFQSKELRYTDQLNIPGITALSLPEKADPTKVVGYLFTSFCPGATKDKPARASLHEYRLGGDNKINPFPSIMSKSLFQAEESKSHWSPMGDAALITLQTSVDASGESYYGSSKLFLLTPSNSEAQAVQLHQDGPVHAVQWMPNPNKPPCFCVVAGKMPAMASLHHGQTGKATFLFGNAHRNTISFAPHGRFALLAGFGNLAGGMSFWDRNKMKLVQGSPANTSGHLRCEAVVGYDWSPDSRLLVVSTTSPRMNVDNGARLFRYNGEELVTVAWNNADYKPDQLLQVSFVPSLIEKYPDRPQSPERDGGAAPAAAAPVKQAPPAAAAPKRYVPPSARGRPGGGTSLAERMRKENDSTMQGATKVDASKPAIAKTATGKVIPGLAIEDASKSKSAMKRDKAKIKKQQEEERKEAEEAEQKILQEAQQQDPEKRARKINKTLKQIGDLKTKDPTSLNDEQKAKIATEEELVAELAKLGV